MSREKERERETEVQMGHPFNGARYLHFKATKQVIPHVRNLLTRECIDINDVMHTGVIFHNDIKAKEGELK